MDALREKYPVEDWQYEVANGHTILGYEEWVMHCKEQDESDQHSERGYETVDLVAYLEMARIALDRYDVRDQIAEGTDLSDEEIQRLTVQLNKHLDEGKPKMNRKETTLHPSAAADTLKDDSVVTVSLGTNKIIKALCALVWTSHTREYLRKHDPKALEQADQALKDAGYFPACGWHNLDK